MEVRGLQVLEQLCVIGEEVKVFVLGRSKLLWPKLHHKEGVLCSVKLPAQCLHKRTFRELLSTTFIKNGDQEVAEPHAMSPSDFVSADLSLSARNLSFMETKKKIEIRDLCLGGLRF